MHGATLGDGTELMRAEVGDARSAGDGLFEVTVGLRRLLDEQVGVKQTVWRLDMLEGCDVAGWTRADLTSLLDSIALAARRRSFRAARPRRQATSPRTGSDCHGARGALQLATRRWPRCRWREQLISLHSTGRVDGACTIGLHPGDEPGDLCSHRTTRPRDGVDVAFNAACGRAFAAALPRSTRRRR